MIYTTISHLSVNTQGRILTKICSGSSLTTATSPNTPEIAKLSSHERPSRSTTYGLRMTYLKDMLDLKFAFTIELLWLILDLLPLHAKYGIEGKRHQHQHHDLVPLAALISREMRSEKRRNQPFDTDMQLNQGKIFDGHNGNAAALYSRDNLLNHILSAIPHGLGREEWLQALPRALVAGQTSGTTATFVVVDRWTVTVASVGDSRCILDTQGGDVSVLTVDHRLEENQGRGLCLSRSIGDMDVGEFIVPIPYVKQVKLSNAGGRLIIASDGIWDAISSDIAAKSCRGLPAELAARQVVKEALRARGLRDDTTCIVVDIIPPDNAMPPPSPPPRKQNKLRSFFFRTKSNASANKLSKKLSAVGIVEELLKKVQPCLQKGLFICGVCQVDIAASEGISVHAGSIFSTSSKPGKVLFFVQIVVIRKMQWREKGQVESKSPNTLISFPTNLTSN
ncbi:hypothetical protein E3N88_31538 [Mikania micrantha]|uniref:PPM-type phosphatase domain-containing protein n=1 Tax=Mikania micrantha TaxID=192012 RepID=A0A5N6MSP0_9ASTR|nr:hypothetical protein E3N88_31538 [Mikania micrantha]